MAESVLGDIKNLLVDVVDKLTSLVTKLSTVKPDQPRLPGVLELRFPEYDGKDEPAVWLHRCEIFFRLQRTEEEDKVPLASFHMTGAAQIWYMGLERGRGGVPAWQLFAESARLRFGAPAPPRGDTGFPELIRLVQQHHDGAGGSVEEYRKEFLGLLDRCDGLCEALQLGMFMAGLPDPLRDDVTRREPATLQVAAWLALELERLQELSASGMEN